MIRFPCPVCAKRLKVVPEHAGGMVRCPRCRTRVEAPPDEFANAPSVFVPVDSPTAQPPPITISPEEPPSAWLLFVGSLNFWLRTLWSLFWLFAFMISERGPLDAFVCFGAWTLVWPLSFAIAVIGAVVESIANWLRTLDTTHHSHG